MFGNSILGGFHHWGYTRESSTAPASLSSWFTPNTNTIRCNLRPTPRSHLLEGELIHWAGKAKNAWLIVGWLPIKAEWWDGPLVLQDLSWRDIRWIKISEISEFSILPYTRNRKLLNIRMFHFSGSERNSRSSKWFITYGAMQYGSIRKKQTFRDLRVRGFDLYPKLEKHWKLGYLRKFSFNRKCQ